MRRRPTALILGLIVCACAAVNSRTTNDAVYSKVQARTGEQLYQEHCLLCHDKKYFRPVLKAWDGRSLAVFFGAMRSSMPQINPGALRDQEYVDILAYILSLSRYPAGDVELNYSDGTMDEITIAIRQ